MGPSRALTKLLFTHVKTIESFCANYGSRNSTRQTALHVALRLLGSQTLRGEVDPIVDSLLHHPQIAHR